MSFEDIEVFNGIKKESLKKIKENSEIITLKKNACLYTDKEKLRYIYFVIKGNVSLIKSTENGEDKVIFILKSGDMINQPIMRNETSAIECWGFTNSKILKICFDIFEKIMSQDYTLARNCMSYMEKRIRRLYRQLKNTAHPTLEKRLCVKLYRLGLEYGESKDSNFIKINLNITVTYLAKMLGCHRESLSRILRRLEKEEVIKILGRTYFVDMKKAHDLAIH